MSDLAKSLLDNYLPEVGKAYRQVRGYRRLRDTFQTQPEFGFKFLGMPEMVAGTFEPEEVAIVREFLPGVDRFVDVGANIGYYTCIARQMKKPVIAFEPLEVNLMLLYANLKENGWLDTEVWPIGLGNSVGMAPLFGTDTAASLIKGWAKQTNPIASAICINTLDNVIGSRFSSERLMMKIDVEGFEMAVLKGSRNLFDRPQKPIVLIEISLAEHHPTPNKHYRETFEFFWQRNYQILTADARRRIVSTEDLIAWEKDGICGWHAHNWIALPRQ